MKHLILAAALLLVPLAPLDALAEAPPAKATVPLQALHRLEIYMATLRSMDLWPGYRLLDHTLVYVVDERFYLMNASARDTELAAGSMPVPGLTRIREIPAALVDRLALRDEGSFYDKRIAGDRVYVARRIAEAENAAEEPIHEFLVQLHEVFHHHQDSTFTLGFGLGNEDYLQADDYAWTQVEARLLGRLLLERDPARLQQGVTLYLAVRAKHESLIPMSIAMYRNAMDITEGTAQYLTDCFLARVRPSLGENHVAYTREKLSQVLMQSQSANRTRYYRMGSALCHLLDRLGGDWRHFDDPEQTFDRLLAARVGLPQDPEGTIRRLGPSYSLTRHWEAARVAYAPIARAKAEELAAALSRHRGEGAVQVVIDLPSLGLDGAGHWSQSWEVSATQKLQHAKSQAFSVSGTDRTVLTFQGSCLTTRQKERQLKEFFRNARLEDWKVDGQAIASDARRVRGRLNLTTDDLSLSVQLGELEITDAHTVKVRVITP